MTDSSDERSFEPTPQRRQRASEQGQVAYSRDLVAAATLLAGLYAMCHFGDAVFQQVSEQVRSHLAVPPDPTSSLTERLEDWYDTVLQVALIMLPILAAPLLAAIFVNILQVGLAMRWTAVVPNPDRSNPVTGLQRVCSLAASLRGISGLIKLLSVGCVIFFYVYRNLNHIYSLSFAHRESLLPAVFYHIQVMTMWVGGMLLALGLIDYGVRKWHHEWQLRMTAHEIREELRSMRIDPQMTARRQIMRQRLDEAA